MSGISWLTKGADSAKLYEAEKAAAEKRKAEQGKLWRFFLKKGEEARLLFVDGELTNYGMLDCPRFYEHFVMFGGNWTNIPCPQQTKPEAGDKCPICEGAPGAKGDRPSLISIFTVIDLRPFKTKEGKTIPFTRRLFAAKPTTFEVLNKLAIKRGGLSGCIFDVSRNGDKSPAVGDMFDFQEKMDVEAAKQKFTVSFKTKEGQDKTVCLFEPANYEKEIIFRTGDELRKMGFGAPTSSMSQSYQQPSSDNDEASGSFEEHL